MQIKKNAYQTRIYEQSCVKSMNRTVAIGLLIFWQINWYNFSMISSIEI